MVITIRKLLILVLYFAAFGFDYLMKFKKKRHEEQSHVLIMFAHFFLSGVINKLKFIDLHNIWWGENETNIMVNI